MLVSAVNAPPRPLVAVPVYYLVSCVVGLRGGGRASHHSWRIVTRILHASLGVGMKLEGSKRQREQKAKGAKAEQKAKSKRQREQKGTTFAKKRKGREKAWVNPGSNWRPSDLQSDALPTELLTHRYGGRRFRHI